MYIKWEEFQDPRITFCGPDHPERRIGESWWEVGVDGLFSGVSVVRGPDGQLLTYMEITSGEVEYTDVATGHRMYYGSPSPFAEGHAGWIESIWDRPASIEEDGYLFKGRSELNGHASLVYEEMWVDERDGGEKIRGMEFVEEQPLLFRSSSYEVGEGGQRTLVSEHRFVEYRVLPEGLSCQLSKSLHRPTRRILRSALIWTCGRLPEAAYGFDVLGCCLGPERMELELK